MYNEYSLKNDFYNIIIKGNLSKLIVMIERMTNAGANIQNENSEHIVSEVLKYIHRNLNEKIKIEDLCKLVNISSTSLYAIFKTSTGKTVIEYINKLKTDKAKQLLIETDMSITDISYELGFNDSAYFYRVFKKNTLNSPKDFRKQRNIKKTAP